MNTKNAFLYTILMAILVNNNVLQALVFINNNGFKLGKDLLILKEKMLTVNGFSLGRNSPLSVNYLPKGIIYKTTIDYQYVYGSENDVKEKELDVKTLLDDISVNNIDSLTKDELIRKEIQKLNQELDDLNQKINGLRRENDQLKDEVNKYYNEDKIKEQKNILIEELKQEARNSKVNLDIADVPDKYISALDLLLIGDIELAEKYFAEFVKDNSNDNKKNKEYLGSTRNLNVFVAYSYYWLGKISNVNRAYKKAVEYFSLSYKFTSFSSLSLIALVGLINSLTNLSKNTDACTAIKQFMQDYEKASNDKSIILDPSYIKLVEEFKSINKCQ